MIKIHKDMTYLSERDLKAIENGIAILSVHSINVGRYYTEEEKDKNSKLAETCTTQEWSQHCDNIALIFAQKMDTIVTELSKHLVFNQYKDSNFSYSSDEWVLHYWRSQNKDSLQLSLNSRKAIKDQLQDIKKAISIIENLEIENVSARIQYKAIYNDSKVSEIAKSVCERFIDTFIDYGGYVGKIKALNRDEKDVRYVFYKKGARKNYYNLDDKVLLDVYFDNLAV